MNKKIRIKDIAARAGVSVGTVDRVLHNRPNVSAESLAKVNGVLEELNYEPNMYASALAYNRSFTFYCLMPRHTSEAYWDEVEDGILEAVDFRRDFHIDVKFIHYSRLDSQSFQDAANDCLLLNPNGVILVPPRREQARGFADKLHTLNVPLVLLDSYIEELEPLTFFGQDSFQSGYFAAKILMMIASQDDSVMIMKQGKEGFTPSRQQENREVGFRHYMGKNHPGIAIKDLMLPLDGTQKDNDRLLEEFFHANPEVHHCITFNSRAWIVGEYLLRHQLDSVQIMGYDVVHKNAECIRRGTISFLIAQHGFMQGFKAVDTLFRSLVLKEEIRPINYMPIELLSLENIDFYQRSTI